MQENALPQPSEEQLKDSSPPQENQLSQTNEEEIQRSQMLSSKEMPQWLRSELEAGSLQEIEEEGMMPEGAEGAVGQFREQLASTQRQTTAMGTQPSYIYGSHYMVHRERGGCLTAWLAFVGILNALALILGFVMTSTFGPFSLLYVVSSAVALMGVVGTWQLKKWGYYILVALYGISVVVGLLVVSFSVYPFLGSLFGLSIISVLVLSRWEDFE